jgi:hypothetical protein
MNRFAVAQPPYPRSNRILVGPQAPVGLASLVLGLGQGWVLHPPVVVPGKARLHQLEVGIPAEDGDPVGFGRRSSPSPEH